MANFSDIARLAGVSRTTVSLSLRNNPKISTSVRARVRAIARKIGYHPNPLLNAHMAHVRTLHPPTTGLSIAFICNRSLPDLAKDRRTPVRKYFHACRERAQSLGYQVELFNIAEPGMTEKRLVGILRARGVRGMILHPLNESGALPKLTMDIREFATVMIEHAYLKPPLHKVCDDQFATIGRLIQKMLDSGYSRIGIAMESRMDEHANHHWLAGYQTYQALCGDELRIPHLITPEWCAETFLEWYRRWRPEAIITIDEDIVPWLRGAGINVPREVACATLYWREDRPYLSGYYQHHEVIGANAVDMVVEQLYHNERGAPKEPKTVLAEAVWKTGTTMPSRSKAGFRSTLRIWRR